MLFSIILFTFLFLTFLVTCSDFPSMCYVHVCVCLHVSPKQVYEGGDPVSAARFLGFSVWGFFLNT